MQKGDYKALYDLEETFWWFAGMREISSVLFRPFLSSQCKRTVLDAGCGTGGNLSWLRAYTAGEPVAGIDLVSAAIEFCRERGEQCLAQGSVVHLPFADEVFDVVTSFDVLVQLPGNNADEQALQEMYRVLRVGGLAFVRVAAYEWMRSGHDDALGTQRRYDLSELKHKIESVGFQIERSTYVNTLLLPFAALNRLVLKPIGLSTKGSDVKPLGPWLQWANNVLKSALFMEARWLTLSKAGLPFGLSAVCIAKKPKSRIQS